MQIKLDSTTAVDKIKSNPKDNGLMTKLRITLFYRNNVQIIDTIVNESTILSASKDKKRLFKTCGTKSAHLNCLTVWIYLVRDSATGP